VLEGKSTGDLIQLLSQVDNLYYEAEILQALLNREGLYFQVAGETMEEKLEKLAQKCGSLQVWYVCKLHCTEPVLCYNMLSSKVSSNIRTQYQSLTHPIRPPGDCPHAPI